MVLEDSLYDKKEVKDFEKGIDLSDYPYSTQPTAEEFRCVGQIRNLIGYAGYVAKNYPSSKWVHFRFEPNETQIAYLKSRGYRIYRKEELEENGVGSHRRLYVFSLNWASDKEQPKDKNLIEV